MDSLLINLTDRIEGITGCYQAVWREWPVRDLYRLYIALIDENDDRQTELAEQVYNTYRHLIDWQN